MSEETEEQIITNKLKRVWNNCLNTELRNTIDTTIGCIEKLQDENKQAREILGTLEVRCNELFLQTCEQAEKIKELEKQIEKMKSDVTDEIGIAGGFNELHTYSVLNNLLNRWEIKNDR